MTVNRSLGVIHTGTAPTQVGTTPMDARIMLAGLVAENAAGVPRQGLLTQSAPNVVIGKTTMSYDVLACNPVITRTAGEGVYLPTLTGVTNVATGAAPGSGSRWDLVWVRQGDPEKGDADNSAVVGVTQGSSGASPTKPYASVPAGAYVLAESLVGTNITQTTAASISQVWRHTAARGAPIPVRTQAERDEITPFESVTVKRLDRAGVQEQYRSGSWASDLQVQIGQGANPPIFKSLEVAVTLDSFAVGNITFPVAFPNALVSTSLMRNHTTGQAVSFNIVTGGTDKTKLQFVANGVPASTLIYVTYQCWGY